METLSEALARLERAGYRDSFRAEDGQLRALEAGRSYPPEQLVAEEIVRFEGDSDPQDQLVLFALRSSDGAVRGTWLASYGAQTDAESAGVMRRLGKRGG